MNAYLSLPFWRLEHCGDGNRGCSRSSSTFVKGGRDAEEVWRARDLCSQKGIDCFVIASQYLIVVYLIGDKNIVSAFMCKEWKTRALVCPAVLELDFK